MCPADTDHVALKGILNARQALDRIDAFLHSIDEFDIKPVHDAFDKGRKHCKLLAQDLFDADVALQLRAKSGPPAGPLFEQEAEERAAADRAEMERQATGDGTDQPSGDPPAEVEKKKRGRPKKRAPEGAPAEDAAEPEAAPEEPASADGVTYELRRDTAVGGATYACRLLVSRNGMVEELTGLSRPIEPRELPALTPDNLPSLFYDETPEMLGWAAGQLKAIEGEG
jgi:hypothetical protein